LARSVPAAALRGLISGLSGCALLYAANVERSITPSPRTSTRPPASIASGTPSARARTSGVTSSPVVPSPRVTARASRPSS
jgi:hypothetical protein